MRRLLIVIAGLICLAPLAARAADPMFTVKNVPVDASAAASVEAQTLAINRGRPKAWSILFRRLTKQADWSKEPQLDDSALQHLIKTFDISNERRSTTRYVANVTYVFSATAVERLLRAKNIPFILQTVSKKFLVIAMSPTYSPNAPWAETWSDPHLAAMDVPLVVPKGDEEDDAVLGRLHFESARLTSLGSAATRYQANDAVLAQLSAADGHVVVKLRRLGAGTPVKPIIDMPYPKDQPARVVYPQVADAVVAAISDALKGKAAIDLNQKSRVIAEARFSSLSAWAALQSRLAGVQTVVGLETIAIDSGEARFSIAYVGSFDQLRDSLNASGISMNTRDGVWWAGTGNAR